MNTSTEQTYYSRNGVLITSTRAEINGKTFVMSNVTSVGSVVVPPETGCAVAVLIVGSLIAFLGLVFTSIVYPPPGRNVDPFSVLILIFGVVVLIVGATIWLFSPKQAYALVLNSSSGESRVMQSSDRADIEKIVAAIKESIMDSDVKKVQPILGSQSANDSSLNSAQKLKVLKEMLDGGTITLQEYENKKSEILSRM